MEDGRLFVREVVGKSFHFWFNPGISHGIGPPRCRQAFTPDALTDTFRRMPVDDMHVHKDVADAEPSSDKTCKRLAVSIKQLEVLLAALPAVPPEKITQLPSKLSQLPVPENATGPLGHFNAWAKDSVLPPCINDCLHPLVCISTGSCRCVFAHCNKPKRWWDTVATGHVSVGLATSPAKWTSQDVAAAVNATQLTSLMMPAGFAGVWPNRWSYFPAPIVPPPPENLPSIYACDTRQFSMDDVVIQGMRDVGTTRQSSFTSADRDSIKPESFFLVPYYQTCSSNHMQDAAARANRVQDFYAVSNTTVYPSVPADRRAWVLSSDWGGCLNFEWSSAMWGAELKRPEFLRTSVVFQAYGDWDSPCFMPHKDVLVPPRLVGNRERTMLGLLETFPLATITPVNERKRFAFFSGNVHGNGAIVRCRIMNNKVDLFPETHASNAIDRKAVATYPDVLGETQFCLAPAGVVTWSFRLYEIIMAGCIPVLTSSYALFPYFDLLDYSDFAVRVEEADIVNIEPTLLAISPAQKQRLQVNVLRLRTVLQYHTPQTEAARFTRPGDDGGNATDVGGLEMALANLAIRYRTYYP